MESYTIAAVQDRTTNDFIKDFHSLYLLTFFNQIQVSNNETFLHLQWGEWFFFRFTGQRKWRWRDTDIDAFPFLHTSCFCISKLYFRWYPYIWLMPTSRGIHWELLDSHVFVWETSGTNHALVVELLPWECASLEEGSVRNCHVTFPGLQVDLIHLVLWKVYMQ